MDKQDLVIEICYELDTIRLMCSLCDFAIERVHEAKNIKLDHLDLIFRDIYKKTQLLGGLIEKLENFEA